MSATRGVPALLLLITLLGTTPHQTVAVDPVSRPAACDPISNCGACTPYTPAAAEPSDQVCGTDGIYFPVPVEAVNSAFEEPPNTATRWRCIACCNVGCDQDNCAFDKYEYSVDGSMNDFGCKKCSAGTGPLVDAGELSAAITNADFPDAGKEVMPTGYRGGSAWGRHRRR
jgi:hypothetical protein